MDLSEREMARPWKLSRYILHWTQHKTRLHDSYCPFKTYSEGKKRICSELDNALKHRASSNCDRQSPSSRWTLNRIGGNGLWCFDYFERSCLGPSSPVEGRLQIDILESLHVEFPSRFPCIFNIIVTNCFSCYYCRC